MDVQISHRVHTKISAKDHIQQIQRKHRTDTERSMQMERSGDHRRESDGGSYSPASKYPTEVQCIELHGISEGEKCADDLRSTRELEIQVREPTLLVERVLCEHSRFERSDDSEVRARAGEARSDDGSDQYEGSRRPL